MARREELVGVETELVRELIEDGFGEDEVAVALGIGPMRPEHPAAVVAPSGEVPPERVRVDEDGGLGGPALEVEVAPDLLADPVRARVAEHEVVGDIRVVVGRHDEEESPLAVSFGPGVDAELHTARRMGRRGPASCGADDGLAAGATAGSAGSVAGSVFAAGCAGLSAAIVVVIRGRVSAAAGDESERQSQVDERARHGFLRMATLRQNRTGDITAGSLLPCASSSSRCCSLPAR